MIENKDLDKCYGCFACANACPQNCIEMKHDEEGFFKPIVNHKLCTNCGICDKVCIIDNKIMYTERLNRPECVYGYLRNDSDRKASASGGAAFALSKFFFKNGGIVYGVVGKWFEDVHHIRSENIDDLEKIRGSKNIQSRIGDMYKCAKNDLDNGRSVLFTGTPCQIKGLYSFLGKDYQQLLTLELVCHGVPSQKVLLAYIKELEKKHNAKVIKFGRDETLQYFPVQYIAWFDDGTYEVLTYTSSLYRMGFLSDLFIRNSCSNCAFAELPRIADITLGDAFFTINERTGLIDLKVKENTGANLILINSLKGKEALNNIEDIFYTHRFSLDWAISLKDGLNNGRPKNTLRNDFFEIFLTQGFENTENIIKESYKNNLAIENSRFRKKHYHYLFTILKHPLKNKKQILWELHRLVKRFYSFFNRHILHK